MFLQSLVGALVAGLVAECLASPLVRDGLPEKREIPASHVLHERHNSHRVAGHWSKRSKVAAGTLLPMRIGLKQPNLDVGHERLMKISDPTSSHYGMHMTSEEVIDFFKPDRSSINAVIDWLVSSGVSREHIGLSANKQWVQFDATVEKAENLLFTNFYVWESGAGGSKDVACEEYHVPSHIQEHIDYITPGTRLRQASVTGNLKSKQKAKRTVNGLQEGNGHHGVRPDTMHFVATDSPDTNSTSCDVYITADCVRAQYEVPKGSTAAAGNKLGIFESLNDHYSQADLDLFLSTIYPNLIPKGTYPENRLIDGAIGSVEDVDKFFKVSGYPAGEESNLDFQASMPLIWPQETVLFQTDDWYWEQAGSEGFFNTFLDGIDGSYCTYSAFNETGDCTDESCFDPSYPDSNWNLGYQGKHQCGVYKPTNVISISYGGIEDLLPNNYQQRQCNEYMKLGLQGVTVVVASGDYGVGSALGCINGTIFAPDFPANCPYVLSVGSTELDRPNATAALEPWHKLEEVATTKFYSGGGFSNVYGVADYQREAVQAYYDQVESSLPFSAYHQIIVDGNFPADIKPNQLYHHGGRGYPDVAAVGDRQLIVYGQEWYTIGGTSLSAPVWASVLTLINEERIAKGKRTLGFVNPIFYANADAFNDIAIGTNAECSTTSGKPAGFSAAKGWDPVTGLGSPNFPVLSKVLLEAP